MNPLAAMVGGVLGLLLCLITATQFSILLAAVALTLLLMRWPLLGMLAFAGLSTCIPYTTVQLGLRTTVSEAVLGLTWGAVALKALIGQYRGIHPYRLTERAVLGLVFFSLIPFLAGQLSIEADGPGLVNWLRWLLNVSPLFLLPLLVRDQRQLEWLIQSLLLGTLVALLVSVTMFIKDRNAMSMLPLLTGLHYAHPEAVQDIFSANYTRMASPWVHPNLTGGALALIVPVAFFYAWPRPGWRRLLGLSVTLLGCAGLLLSISRGAMVSLALVLGWLTFLRMPYGGRILSLGALMGVALVLAYPPLQERLGTMLSSSNASTEIRMDEYRAFPEAMLRYPLGIGFKVDPPVPGSGLLGISNLWLNYIYKLGIPGMLLFTFASFRWWREVRPKSALRHVTEKNSLWIGTTSGVLAALLSGFFDHYFSFTMVLAALFWLFVAISLQQARLHRQNQDQTQ